MPIPWVDDVYAGFPPIDEAMEEPNGLLAAGDDLSEARLLDAYLHGIFPWYEVGQPVLWWSPDPRMVLKPDRMRISRSLTKLLLQHKFTVTMDTAFAETITGCANAERHSNGTWITTEMQSAYIQLHKSGYAHSIEVWQADRLVGGLYGVALGKIFFGESMFSEVSNTSKLALAYLTKQLQLWDFQLIDCQVSSPHLRTLGAVEISRVEFQKYLQKYAMIAGSAGKWQLQSNLLW